jgi:hypothetical protein
MMRFLGAALLAVLVCGPADAQGELKRLAASGTENRQQFSF